MNRIFSVILIMILPLSVGVSFSCQNDGKDEPSREKPEVEFLKDAPYKIGAALNMNSLRNREIYRNTVISEFSSITAENAMKMGSISRGRGQYFWDDADYLVSFAQEHGIRVHGHALVWYKQSATSMPDWVKNFQGTKEEWKQIMKEYITDVVTRYKGKVTSWDVVNEAIKDDGSFRTAEECIWTRNIGVPEYIDWAFQCAHEADPDALLFYNDYGHEYSAAKRAAINNLVKGMLERGVPIHGVGLQMHTHTDRAVSDIRTAILTAAQTGLKVHVSELDVAVNRGSDKNIVYTDELKQKQYDRYQAAAKAMSDLSQAQQHGITMWGVGDQDSFMYNRPDWPLPFDENYQRKPAYDGLTDGF